jgi:glutamate carboxypeptidase
VATGISDSALLQAIGKDEPEIVDLIGDLVRMPSPSGEKPLVDRLGDRVSSWLSSNGFQPHLEKRSAVGDIIWAETGNRGDGRLMVLSHLDTVWHAEASDRNPFRQEGDRIYGPGIFDMKSGVAASLKVQEYLRKELITPRRKVRFVYTTDEETGSLQSRELIEEFARQCDVVLVTEPPLPGGSLKTFRKGSGFYEIEVLGKSAHAGLEPTKGINAVEELALQICAVRELADTTRGTTVAVTASHGGEAVNVIPEKAAALVDVRFRVESEGARLDAALRSLEPRLPGARLRVSGQLDRPPMARSERTVQLFAAARHIAAPLGIDLGEGESGGGSDGNFTAAQGIPTLDGLGIEGDGAHAWHEHILRSSIVPRVALLARLIERL